MLLPFLLADLLAITSYTPSTTAAGTVGVAVTVANRGSSPSTQHAVATQCFPISGGPAPSTFYSRVIPVIAGGEKVTISDPNPPHWPAGEYQCLDTQHLSGPEPVVTRFTINAAGAIAAVQNVPAPLSTVAPISLSFKHPLAVLNNQLHPSTPKLTVQQSAPTFTLSDASGSYNEDVASPYGEIDVTVSSASAALGRPVSMDLSSDILGASAYALNGTFTQTALMGPSDYPPGTEARFPISGLNLFLGSTYTLTVTSSDASGNAVSTTGKLVVNQDLTSIDIAPYFINPNQTIWKNYDFDQNGIDEIFLPGTAKAFQLVLTAFPPSLGAIDGVAVQCQSKSSFSGAFATYATVTTAANGVISCPLPAPASGFVLVMFQGSQKYDPTVSQEYIITPCPGAVKVPGMTTPYCE
jgi:hypothetical protein